MKLEVGQKLWWVPSHRHNMSEREVTVEKVGRKWATLDCGYRIDVASLVADVGGYSSPGKCYPTREEWSAENALGTAWSEFASDIRNRYRRPEGVTIEDIRQARELLKLGGGTE
jgi:hypothetical protein